MSYYEPNKYDLAILDVDQMSIDDLRTNKGKFYKELNATIQDIPKIVINHGTPWWPEWHTNEDIVDKMKILIGDNTMVVNSYKAAEEWGWGHTIWHGMGEENAYDLPKEARVVTAVSPAGLDTYYNRKLCKATSDELSRRGIQLIHFRINIQFNNWEEYKDYLGRSLVYFDFSLHTPMNRAKTEGMLCLKPESKVIMADDFGCKEIKDVKIGDSVIDKDGNSKKVKNIHSKETEEVFYTIQARGHDKIKCSGEHKFLAIRTKMCQTGNRMVCRYLCKQRCTPKYYKDYKLEWVKAKDLKINDFLISPVDFNNNVDTYIKISDYVSKNDLIERDGYVRYRGCRSGLLEICKEKQYNYKHIQKCLRENKYLGEKSSLFLKYLKEGGYLDIGFFKNELETTKELCRFIGYYIAEGYVHKSTIVLCFHQKETKYHKDVVDLVKEVFNLDVKVSLLNNNRAVISFTNKVIAEFLENICGKGCKNKKVPKEIINSNRENLIHLLSGLYRGDGCIREEATIYSTTSVVLAYQIYFVLKKLKIHGTISRVKQRERMTCDSFRIYSYGEYRDKITEITNKLTLTGNASQNYKSYFKDDNYWYYPIKKIEMEDYKGKVYDLTVEGHNYLVNGLVAHNSGCALVTAHNNDVERYIENGVNGFIVPNNPVSVANIIEELLSDYDRAIAIGAKGKETAKKLFGREQYRQSWLKLISEVLCSK